MTQATYDYIIVGAGSAGGFLALRLSEDPSTRVLLLEAGPTDAHLSTQMPAAAQSNFLGGPRNWCFETDPEPYMHGRKIFQPRGKTLGGSSSINGMVFVRGHQQDFAQWVNAGAEGWGYWDVIPHYTTMETYRDDGVWRGAWRGTDGPVIVTKPERLHPIEEAFLTAGEQAGHQSPEDYNGAVQEGVTRFDANIENGWRSGTGRACIQPASSRSNCTVITGAHATRVMIEQTRAVGIAYRQDGKDLEARAEREVILSAGAFQTPQLLMLSGIGPADHVQSHGIYVVQDTPGVGQNLQDHLEVHLRYQCPHKGKSMNKWLSPHRKALAGMMWRSFKKGPAAGSLSKVGAFLRSDASVEYPDIQIHFWPYLIENWSPPPNKDGYGCSTGPLRSASRGWVRLGSADPFAAPRIQLNGLSDQRDLDMFRAAIHLARDIASQKAFDFCRGPELSPGPNVQSNEDLDEYVRANANSAYHPCGTARMGNDPLAVTDSRARVHGIQGLRVADASIMPTITNGNINAPCMMIGEKVSRMILADNG